MDRAAITLIFEGKAAGTAFRGEGLPAVVSRDAPGLSFCSGRSPGAHFAW
jgi:hypothetical protein